MNLAKQIATHFRTLHFGGNSTGANLKDTVADVTWEQAIKQVHSLNTIATLVFHVNYYVSAVLQVLQGGPLTAKDAYSFDLEPIESQEAWEQLCSKALSEAATFADLVEQLPDEKFGETFVDEKYGNYYRNIHGIIEHTYYHMGQMALVKKIMQQQGS